MEPKHTPGPWQVEETTDYNAVYRVMDEQEVTVALCYQQPNDTWLAKDNARLIAAAPELLIELKHALADVKARLHVMPANVRDIERAILNAQIVRYEAAIAKAEGKQ